MRKVILALVGVAGGLAAATYVSGARAARVRVDAPVELTRSAAGNPTVGYDERTGTAFVAWIGGEPGKSNVYLAAARPDGSVDAAVQVNDRPGDAAPHDQAPAQVSVGPNGSVYVVWQATREIPGRRFPASDLRFARSRDGGKTFAPAVTVNDDAGGLPSSHTFHDLAVAPDGTIYVSWLDSRARDSVAASRPKPAHETVGGRASTADAHGADAASAEHGMDGHSMPPHAADDHGMGGASTAGRSMGGHGGHGSDNPTLPGSEIRVARSTDGGKTFQASRVVDAGVCPCCRTSLAVGPDGAVYVAWRKVFAGDVRDVVVARHGPNEAAFSAPVRVHEDGWVYPGCPHAGPSLAVDGRGRLHVAWYTGREGRQGLWHAVSADGGKTFGEATAVLTGGWVPPAQVRLAPAGDGVWMTWDDRREKTPHLSLALATDDGGIQQVGSVEAGRTPALAAGVDRMEKPFAAVAWLDGTSIRLRRLHRLDANPSNRQSPRQKAGPLAAR